MTPEQVLNWCVASRATYVQSCRLLAAVFTETRRERAEVHESVIITTRHGSVIPPISAWISLSHCGTTTACILSCTSHMLARVSHLCHRLLH